MENFIRNPVVDANSGSDESMKILDEVFDDLHRNLFEDYKNKLNVIIDIYNNEAFLKKSNNRIKDLLGKLRELPAVFETLKIETMRDLNVSVFQGICTLKKNLDLLITNSACQNIFKFDIYEFLNSIASETFKELFDEKQTFERKIEKLFSIIFDGNHEPDILVYLENGRDVTNKVQENINSRKKEFEEILFNMLISKLTDEFKPLEKKLIDAQEISKVAKISANGGMIAGAILSVLFPGAGIGFAASAAVAGYGGAAVIDNKLKNRKEKGWFKSIEKEFIDFLKSENSENDKKRIENIINGEELENDKHYFIDTFNSFFTKYNLKTLFGASVDFDFDQNNIETKLKKINKEGFLLTFEQSWIIIKAFIFNKQEMYDRLEKLDEKLQCISQNMDSNEYLPLIWFKLVEKKDEHDNENLNLKINGLNESNKELLKKLVPTAKLNESKSEITIEKSSFNKLMNILLKVSDFKFKSILIKDYQLAIGSHALNPRFNRRYGASYLSSDDNIDISSFIPTKFDVIRTGGYPYYCPNGWFRYSLKVSKSSEEFDRKYSDWPVVYHGTSSLNLMNILKIGFKMSSAPGCIAHGQGLYLSPSIEYSAHNRYSKVMKIKNGKYYIQTVFQCRVNPRSFIRGRETLLKETMKSEVIDSNFKNDQIEWVITPEKLDELREQKQDALVIYGIMIRITKQHPKDLPYSKWWDHCHFTIP